VAWYLNLLFCTKNCFLEAKLKVVAEVFATLCAIPITRGSCAEKLAKNVAKDVLETRREIEAATKRALIAERGMAELIIERPPLRIRQYLISLGDFLERFFCLLVSGITVGMIFQCQFAVSLFDFFLTGVTL
jgi:hypothetical protein